MIILTDHFTERYRERIGTAPPRIQKAWVSKSMRTGRPKRQSDGKYALKLAGTNHVAILSYEYGHTWVALTVK